MHAGRIDAGDLAAAGRVYSHLRRHPGMWVDGWSLAMAVQSTAVSTRVSEVRAQLPPGQTIEVKRVGDAFFYRLVVAERKAVEALPLL